MSLQSMFTRAYDIVFREFPHRSGTGLFPMGDPGQDSPVVVTGNYTETVRRLKAAMKGVDAWLLVANSKGINVWCAAGGGHFTHHDIISAIVTSRISEKVKTRKIILPQLSATGVERKKISDATGWEAIWGPAMLQDLPDFIRQEHNATPTQRNVRFPLVDRLEMATLWGVPMLLIGFLIFFLLGGLSVGLSIGAGALLISYGLFTVLPKLDINGMKKWIPFSLFAILAFFAGLGVLTLFNALNLRDIAFVATGSAIEMLSLSMDIAGTTPWYGSYINTFRNHAHIELIPEKCNGSADCLLVCPRAVFQMNGPKHKVDIVSGEDCIECGACIVQCPRDALRFRYDNGTVAEANIIRNTRMNMLGKRTIALNESGKEN